MKIFTLLLLQCKLQPCRMENYLIPKDTPVRIENLDLRECDREFLDAQCRAICNVTTQTNEFVLIKLIEGWLSTCAITGDGFSREHLLTKEDLDMVLSSSSVTETLDKTKIRFLSNLLLGSEIETGALECSRCGERYPIASGIVDFVAKEDALV